ncbi:MAG: hypothetical protein RL500_725, partial [Pseudomonadota bacterium]
MRWGAGGALTAVMGAWAGQPALAQAQAQ